jgi:hypothetical protein
VLILARGQIAAELSRAALSKESIAERCYYAGIVPRQMAEAEP